MAVYREDIIDVDLISGTVHKNREMLHLISEGDAEGDVFGVRILRDGEPVDMAGCSVVGHFIRSDGTTVIITGTRSGSTCYVKLPESCYVVEGNFRLSIKVGDSGKTTTVRIVDGTVINTITGALVDPGGVVPDLSEFEQLVEDINAAAELIEGNITIDTAQITGTRYRIVMQITAEG